METQVSLLRLVGIIVDLSMSDAGGLSGVIAVLQQSPFFGRECSNDDDCLCSQVTQNGQLRWRVEPPQCKLLVGRS